MSRKGKHHVYNQRNYTSFTRKGILRQYEIQNGERQDMHVYGMLKNEFYKQYETIFKLLN